MNPIKIGIIGSGGMSARRAKNFASRQDTVVSAIAARNKETGAKLAKEIRVELVEDWNSLVHSDVDAVFVGTHNQLHGPIILEALGAGKHVFTEYPTSRTHDEAIQIRELIARPSSPVLRASNNESVSAEHTALKQQTATGGRLLTTHFLRLTSGRGRRPDVLFNLELTGPPALFFVYHVHTYVSLFGPAAWVHSSAEYDGLREDQEYDRFMNNVTVGFASGGTGQWTWAGGIEIEKTVQEARISMTEITLLETDTGWDISRSGGTEPLQFRETEQTLEDLFVSDCQGKTDWRSDTQVALDAAAIGHAAEISVSENRVVDIGEILS